MEISLQQLLVEAIACQKRTGKAKMFTFYHQGKILKGPYTEKKVQALLSRFEILQQLETEHLVYPIAVHPTLDGYFVEYPNVGIPPIDKCTTIDNQESFSNYRYKVLVRSGLEKASDVIQTKDGAWIFQYATSISLSMIKILSQGGGDRGLYNVLANTVEKKLYIVDVDENTDVVIRDSGTWYFSKDPNAKYRSRWVDAVDVDSVVADLQRIFGDSEFTQQATAMLEKYRPSNVRIEATSNKGSGISQPVEVVQSNIGSMQNKGLFGSTTYSGYTVDVMKSGLQKYIRRGMLEKALTCGIELYRMAEVGATNIVSNLYNRIAVISAEDIGPANPDLVVGVIRYVLNSTANNRSKEELALTIQVLSESTKTRCLSHIWRAFTTPNGREYAQRSGITVDTLLSPNMDRSFQWLDKDPEEIRDSLEMFRHRIEHHDLNAFYWLGQYLEISKGKKIHPRSRKTKPDTLLWLSMQAYLDPLVYQTLYQAYGTFSENRPFLSLAVYLSLVRYQLSNDVCIRSLSGIWNDNQYLDDLLAGRYQLDIDEYVVDQHTKEGRKQGKSRQNFVHEGAVVNNIAVEFTEGYFPVLEQIYNNS